MSKRKSDYLSKQRRRKYDGVDNDSSDDDDDKVYCRGCKVYFYADVTKKSVYMLITALDEAIRNAYTNPSNMDPCIYLYIHSDGGDAYAGLSAMDHIRSLHTKVITIADGFVASAATFILLAGYKRLGMPHCHVLIHQIRSGFWGKYDEMLDEVKNSKLLMKTLTEIYRSSTRIAQNRLDSLLKQELNLNTALCLKYGVIDEIMKPYVHA